MADENEPSTTDESDSAAPAPDPDVEAGSEVEAEAAADKAGDAKVTTKAKESPAKPSTDGSKPAVKKKVVSKRVTPKGGAQAGATSSKAHAADGHDAPSSSRYTPPTAKYADMPSPTWVPVLMFVLLGLGCMVIVLNYARVFGEPDNWRLVLGLAAILGGIITATNYR